ncbi:hypothetical protein [Paenibacillus sonchi]|uniref:hypothetical protein n=1 Tax=Paenibacillus sonchi TaxID=373687 RepID=UPI001E352D45|nr:hypothetical protein [Paenibacillus sonchi]MCE3202783.1 hypothetical protein [Paenibacillus sonchi]
MKKKVSILFLLTAAISLVTAVPTFAENESSADATSSFAANESSANASLSSIESIVPLAAGESTSVVVNPVTYAFSSPINGAGQYGKISLESSGKAELFVYYNTGDGVWRSTDISYPGTGFIFLDESGGSSSLNFFMNLGWQYKVYVFADTYTAKGYIRNYQ